MVVKTDFSRKTWLSLLVVVLAGAAVVGGYFASQASDGTTAAPDGASMPTATSRAVVVFGTATPRSAVVFGTPPPGVQRGSWTPVPRCPEPTPTPTPSATVPPTPTPAPTRTPAPWPCVPFDYPTPSGTPSPPPATPRPALTLSENCIDLSKPIPYDLPMQVAGKTIHLPAGSIYYIATGTAGMRHVIHRGFSKVVIDAHTGRITQWSVAPADEADFRSLILEPLESLQ